MNTDKDTLSYGSYLKAIRLEKRVTLEEIAQETRIGRDILLRIENEDDEALPAEVFVKGFLRSYAKVIGIDSEEAVKRYLAQRESIQETLAPQKLYVEPRRRLWPLLLAVFIILSGLILVSIYFSRAPRPPQSNGTGQVSSAKDSDTPTPKPEAVAKEEVQPALPEQTEAIPDDQSPPASDESEVKAGVEETTAAEGVAPEVIEPEKLTLAVVAKEETWLKVIIDGGTPREYTLNSGDRLDLAGKVNFSLLIGNAGGVDLSFNGKPFEAPGKSGQVLTLQLP